MVTVALKSAGVAERVKPVEEESPLEKETETVVTVVSLADGLRQVVPPVATAWAFIRSRRTRPKVASAAKTFGARREEPVKRSKAEIRKREINLDDDNLFTVI